MGEALLQNDVELAERLEDVYEEGEQRGVPQKRVLVVHICRGPRVAHRSQHRMKQLLSAED